jgi:hypothetical protein
MEQSLISSSVSPVRSLPNTRATEPGASPPFPAGLSRILAARSSTLREKALRLSPRRRVKPADREKPPRAEPREGKRSADS